MHNLQKRIDVFVQLNDSIEKIKQDKDPESLIAFACAHNPWFTKETVKYQLEAIQEEYLSKEKIIAFSNQINFAKEPKKIGIVCAGNLPLVAFHDWLCVILSGHIALVKLSSQDTILTKFIANEINRIAEEEVIIVQERLVDFHAVIATGSESSQNVFHKYFEKYPSIIRGSRSSIGILHDESTDEEILQLGYDTFQHWGLGCRNIHYLFISKNVDPKRILSIWEEPFSYCFNHAKYMNNYDYQHTLLIMNNKHYYSTNFVNLVPHDSLFSAISNIHYQVYENEIEIESFLQKNEKHIQCIVSDEYTATKWRNKIPTLDFAFTSFGQTQKPRLEDFADGINTLTFLDKI